MEGLQGWALPRSERRWLWGPDSRFPAPGRRAQEDGARLSQQHMAGGKKTTDMKETRVGDTGHKSFFHSEDSGARPQRGCATSSLGGFQDPTGSSLKQPGQTSQLSVRALEELIGLNDPEHPRLGPPPTPMVPGSHLSSAWGHRSLPGQCYRGAGLQFTCSYACPCPLLLLIQTLTHRMTSQLNLGPASSP